MTREPPNFWLGSQQRFRALHRARSYRSAGKCRGAACCAPNAQSLTVIVLAPFGICTGAAPLRPMSAQSLQLELNLDLIAGISACPHCAAVRLGGQGFSPDMKLPDASGFSR